MLTKEITKTALADRKIGQQDLDINMISQKTTNANTKIHTPMKYEDEEEKSPAEIKDGKSCYPVD